MALRNLGLPLLCASVSAATAAAPYSFNPLEHLAGITPYFEPADPPLDPAPPQGCNVTRAAYLVRHAAIYANDFDYETYIEPFLEKLLASRNGSASASSIDWSQAAELSFLQTWTTPVKESDEEKLTKVGELESYQLGVRLALRYASFRQPAKVWASDAERTVRSAQSFVEGLARDDNGASVELAQSFEGAQDGANSLTPYESCPAYSASRGSAQSAVFRDIYTQPIVARLNAHAPGFNFTASDVVAMQELCGYETVIRGSSPFCSLAVFSPNDWLGFEYANDMLYFHNTGYGNPLSGTIGWPWLNATGQLLVGPASGDGNLQDLYVSFTHRETPPLVMVALGLFNNSAFGASTDVNATMPLDRINHHRAWKSSHILPFLANIALERMECESFGYDGSSYLRILVNQTPQPLPDCVDGPGESCSVDAFGQYLNERGQLFANFGETCGVDYQNSTDVLSIYQL